MLFRSNGQHGSNPDNVLHGQNAASAGISDDSITSLTTQSRTKLFLPAEHKVRELLEGFWETCSLVLPWIHIERFVETYNEVVKSRYTTIRKSWLALLYSILSLAEFAWPYRSSGNARKDTPSEAWYQMASDTCLPLVFSESAANLETGSLLIAIA